MRALRSRTIQNDNNESNENTEEIIHKKGKRNRKQKNSLKIKQEISTDILQNDVFTNSLEPAIKKKTRKTEGFTETKSKRITRNSISVNIIKEAPKENISPNIKKMNSSCEKLQVSIKRTKEMKKITRRNEINCEKNRDSQEYSPTFKNIVTSTAIKPKKLNETINENEGDILNSTFIKIDDEFNSVLTATNNSGQWKIEDVNDVINITDDSVKDSKKILFQETCLSKSARKKWQRFARNSQGANIILEQISTPRNKNQQNSNISRKCNKTGDGELTNKIKRTEMPNFALIHQKAFEKMESISDYSQRKKDRANFLLSMNKNIQTKTNDVTNKTNETATKIKTSRQLFFNEKPDTSKMKFNRFGFKLKVAEIQPPVKLQKPSIYERNDVVAIANKKFQNVGKCRENKREVLKGVRTNRRFDLLMKMRNH